MLEFLAVLLPSSHALEELPATALQNIWTGAETDRTTVADVAHRCGQMELISA